MDLKKFFDELPVAGMRLAGKAHNCRDLFFENRLTLEELSDLRDGLGAMHLAVAELVALTGSLNSTPPQEAPVNT